jgi:general secretion pathway protein M
MKDWFMQLSQREKLMVAGAAAVLLSLLFYLLVIAPLLQSKSQLLDQLETQKRSLGWMKSAASEAQSYLAAGKASHSDDKRSLIARVSTELRKKQITAVKSRPEGENRLNLIFDEVNFVRLMERLQYLQMTYGISVFKATMEPSVKTGYGKVRVTLER